MSRAPAAEQDPPRARRLGVSTLIFSAATALSRIAGLVREVVAASAFGTGGPASAFLLAFQIPNLIRALVADSALSAAFVPVFTELLEKKERAQAIALAASLAGLLLAALAVLTVLFTVAAPLLIPLITGDEFTPLLDDLTVGLAQLMFPIVVLLSLNGLVIGILNAHDHFSVPAIAPLIWNVVIVACMVGLQPLFSGPDELYAYAIGVVAGTAVQLAICLPPLKRIGFPLRLGRPRKPDGHVRQVLLLMLPVSIGLGLINFNALINSTLGTLVAKEVPAAIDKAFRLYMLPQGIFSVAVATVLFPTLSRLAARADYDGLRDALASGLRQIALLLVPAAAGTFALAEPIVRIVYERGAFDETSVDLTTIALQVFCFSLPLNGFQLLLTRTYFSLQEPWKTAKLSGITLAVNAAVSLALFAPFGTGGIVAGTVVSTGVMCVMQARDLRGRLGGLDERRTGLALLVVTLAAFSLGLAAYMVHALVIAALGDGFAAQLLGVGLGLGAASALYGWVLLRSGLPEARQIVEILSSKVPALNRLVQ